jgi:phosphate acetyltransferase
MERTTTGHIGYNFPLYRIRILFDDLQNKKDGKMTKMAENDKIDSIYILSREEGAGSMVLSTGLMSVIVQHYKRVALFTPLFSSRERNDDIETLTKNFHIEQSVRESMGVDEEEAERVVASDGLERLVEILLDRYRQLEKEYDFIVCIGSPAIELNKMLGFDINVELAKNFSAPVAGVFPASGMDREGVKEALTLWGYSITKQGGEIFLLCANRCSEELCDELILDRELPDSFDYPVCCLPEIPELNYINIGNVADTLSLKWLAGESRHREMSLYSVRIVAGSLSTMLGRIEPYELIVTSSDRLDLVSGLLLSAESITTPMSAGIVLCGEEVDSDFIELLEGRDDDVAIPILHTDKSEAETIEGILDIRPAILPGHSRKIASVLGAFSRYIDRNKVVDRLDTMPHDIITPAMFRMRLFERAREKLMRVVMPEIEDDRILRAADILLRRDVARIVLVGSDAEIARRSRSLGLNLSKADTLDPSDGEILERFAHAYYEARKHRGVNLETARDMVMNKTLFATMAVAEGFADGMVSGAIHSTRDTILPALQVIKLDEGYTLASSCFFMGLPTRTLVYADCAVNPDPTAEELAEIAVQTIESAESFGIAPRVAMLSYSTGTSGTGEDVEKVRRATELVEKLRPDIPVAGPIQYDAAIDPEVAHIKMPDNPVAGNATIFIFPDLDTGNIAYKAVQRSSGATAVGPVMQGLRKPVNDLSRGCLVDDIVDTVAITAIQAQKISK